MQILTVWYHALLEVEVCSASASSSRPPHQVPELYQHFTLKKGATEVWENEEDFRRLPHFVKPAADFFFLTVAMKKQASVI